MSTTVMATMLKGQGLCSCHYHGIPLEKDISMVCATTILFAVQSLLLNVDVITMLDPFTCEQLREVRADCKECSQRLTQQYKSSEDI